MSQVYGVKQGETITDVVLNSTGSIVNWDDILSANDFDSWTPDLMHGQQVIIPDSVVIDANNLRGLKTKPLCNSLTEDILDQIDQLIGLLVNNWILKDGTWNDKGFWIDTDKWID